MSQGIVPPAALNTPTLSSDQTWTGAQTFTNVASLAVSGLPGAQNPSRYVGATVGGIPASGSFRIGDWGVDESGAYWVCTGAGTAIANPIPYRTTVIADNPTDYWRLGEASGTFNDTSANNNAGTGAGGLTRAVAGATSDGDGACSFDGSSGIITTTSSYANPTPFSIECWLRTSTTPVSGVVVVGFGNSQTGVSAQYDRLLYIGTDGKLRFAVSTARVVASLATITDGAWHHVVATSSSSTVSLYVDNVLQGTSTAGSGPANYTGYWWIGGGTVSSVWPGTTGSASIRYFNGTLDEVAVYPSVLSATRVGVHYAQASAAQFTSVGGKNGARFTGQPWYDVTSYGAVADAKQVSDGVTTAGSTTLTSATANFQPGDVGKILVVDRYSNTQAGQLKGPASNGHTLSTTIAAVTNSTTVTMADAATNARTGCLVGWGTDNVTAIQKAIDDCHNAGGGVVYIPTGRYQLRPCLNSTTDQTFPYGNKYVSYYAGGALPSLIIRSYVRLQGAGMGLTVLQGNGLYPAPGMFSCMITTEIPYDGGVNASGNVGTELAHDWSLDGITWDSMYQWYGAPADSFGNFSQEVDHGVLWLWNNVRWRVTNCEFLNTGTKPIYATNGVPLVYADRFEILDNYFHQSSGNFFSLNYCSNFIVSRNLIMDGSCDGAESLIGRHWNNATVEGNVFYETGNLGGISAPNVLYPICSDVRIINNYVRGQATSGSQSKISVNQCNRCVVVGNVVDATKTVNTGDSVPIHFPLGAMTDLVVSSNTVQCPTDTVANGGTRNAAPYGIRVVAQLGVPNNRCIVIGNTVAGGGIAMTDTKSGSIANNVIDTAIFLTDNQGQCRAIGNTVMGRCTGFTSGGSTQITGSSTNDTVIQNNYFTTNSTDIAYNVILLSGGGSVLFTGNVFDRGTGVTTGGNTIFENPPTNSPSYFMNNRFLGTNSLAGAVGRLAVFRGNPGLNPVGAVTTPAFPATTVAVTNNTHYDVIAYITAGTGAVTVQVDAVTGLMTIPANGVGTVRIPALSTFTPTYSAGSPIWKWYGE